MPTSKARKRRLVERQKEKQKIALQRKSKVGLKRKDRYHQHGSKSSNALTTVIDFIRYNLNEENNLERGKKLNAAHSSPIEQQNTTEVCLQNENTNQQFLSNGGPGGEDNQTDLSSVCEKGDAVDESNGHHATQKSQNLAEVVVSSKMKTGIALYAPEPEQSTKQHISGLRFLHSVLNAGAWPYKVFKRLQEAFYTMSTGSSAPELTDLKTRVILLEKEMQELKHVLSRKEFQRPWIEKNSNGEDIQTFNKASAVINAQPSQPPPPPPPPPLPPLPAPQSARPVTQKGIVKTKTKQRSSHSSASDKTKSGLHITNDQLRKVKLKKVSFKPETTKMTPAKELQLVTLQDLKKIRLKKAPLVCDCKENEINNGNQTPLRDLTNLKVDETWKKNEESSIPRTPHSGYNLRKTLRKVNLLRSPGGTPLVKSKMETGVGLTPLLTAALKRKFENVNQPSLENSPDF